ncbi:uncharacterized protein LOC116932832 [Daphnia magna]|uniref:uncharacterized protein LOC116932832 n=1 Tax=Daphnia magna TaxID=35525 RepID=UPI001E1BAED0|nr:uncharacterized protein LOC116932832 [Daphnia magna]
MDSAISETNRKLEENGTFWDNLGNYTAILSITYFFVTILQILTRVWEAQGNAAKSTKSVTAREEVVQQQAAETTRIYEALEKLAKVSVSNRS